MFQRSFKDVSRVFRGYFKKGSTVFQVSSKIDECFEGYLWVFQGSFKGISKKLRKFQGCFESVSRKSKGYLKCFNCFNKGSSQVGLRLIEAGALMVFQGSFKFSSKWIRFLFF